VEALRTLVAGFLADLPAAVFVVLQIGPHKSSLPELLTKWGPLPAVQPSHGDVPVKGKIYVAPPDCHLLLDPDGIRLSQVQRKTAAGRP
jgi:two-component system chemotaxis response regulator CheB